MAYKLIPVDQEVTPIAHAAGDSFSFGEGGTHKLVPVQETVVPLDQWRPEPEPVPEPEPATQAQDPWYKRMFSWGADQSGPALGMGMVNATAPDVEPAQQGQQSDPVRTAIADTSKIFMPEQDDDPLLPAIGRGLAKGGLLLGQSASDALTTLPGTIMATGIANEDKYEPLSPAATAAMFPASAPLARFLPGTRKKDEAPAPRNPVVRDAIQTASDWLLNVGKENREEYSRWHKEVDAGVPDSRRGKDFIDDPSLLLNPSYLAEEGSAAVVSIGPPLLAALAGGGPLVGGAVGGAMEGLGSLGKLLDENRAPDDALLRSGAYAAASSALNALSLGKMLDKKVVDSLATKGAKILSTAGVEAFTEWLEGPVETLTSQLGVLPMLEQDFSVAESAARGLKQAKTGAEPTDMVSALVQSAREEAAVVPGAFLVGGGMHMVVPAQIDPNKSTDLLQLDPVQLAPLDAVRDMTPVPEGGIGAAVSDVVQTLTEIDQQGPVHENADGTPARVRDALDGKKVDLLAPDQEFTFSADEFSQEEVNSMTGDAGPTESDFSALPVEATVPAAPPLPGTVRRADIEATQPAAQPFTAEELATMQPLEQEPVLTAPLEQPEAAPVQQLQEPAQGAKKPLPGTVRRADIENVQPATEAAQAPFVQEVLEVGDVPRKTNSSNGSWAVDVTVSVPFGNGQTESQEFFFSKKEAEQFIAKARIELEASASQEQGATPSLPGTVLRADIENVQPVGQPFTAEELATMQPLEQEPVLTAPLEQPEAAPVQQLQEPASAPQQGRIYKTRRETKDVSYRGWNPRRADVASVWEKRAGVRNSWSALHGVLFNGRALIALNDKPALGDMEEGERSSQFLPEFMERAKKSATIDASIVGETAVGLKIKSLPSRTYAHVVGEERSLFVDADLVDAIMTEHPNSIVRISEDDPMVVFLDNGQVVGALMDAPLVVHDYVRANYPESGLPGSEIRVGFAWKDHDGYTREVLDSTEYGAFVVSNPRKGPYARTVLWEHQVLDLVARGKNEEKRTGLNAFDVYEVERPGRPVKYAVRNENLGLHDAEFDTRVEAEARAERDRSYAEKAAKEQEKRDKERAEYESVHGFTDGLTPMRKGRALKVLNKQYRVSGKEMTAKAHIESMVKDDAKIETHGDGKGGAVYVVGGYTVTKTEFDYATFLKGKFAEDIEAQAAPRQTGPEQEGKSEKKPLPGTETKAEKADRQSSGIGAVVDHFAKQLYSGAKYTSIVQARKEASSVLKESVQPGTELAKRVDEAIELAVVKTARRMIREMRQAGATDLEIYKDLVALYSQQPTLGVRTSTSVAQQAYSTPVPIAFLASRLAGINDGTSVLEPTAGNGALLLEAGSGAVVNELNKDRAAQLRAVGFDPLEMDASSKEFVTTVRDKVDVVIANPPFGRVREDNGSTKTWLVAGYETKELDHAIVLRAMELLNDDGRAVLIIGGKQGEGNNRAMKYHSVSQRQFYNALFSNFRVADHFTISGDLYSKQGAGYPIDVIVIDGRGKTEGRKFPAAETPRIYESFTALEGLFNEERSMDAGVRVSSSDAGASGRVDRNQQPGRADSSGGNQGQRVDPQDGRAGVGGPTHAEDAGRGGVDRPVHKSEGAVRGGRTGDSKPAGQTGTQGQDSRQGEREQGGLSAQAKQPDAGMVQRGESSGLGERDSRDVETRGAKHDRQAAKPASKKDALTKQQMQSGTALQDPYTPRSKSVSMGTLVPKNMAMPLQEALDRIEATHGNIDDYVAKELGYSKREMEEYFAGEQVDAIALAIHNIDKGAGFIIGDQTGIGKGRVNAAIIRYARRKGAIPVFVTMKPDLYADMVRDLQDIGMPGFSPLVTNAGLTGGSAIPLPDGRTMRTPAAAKHTAILEEQGRNGVKDYDAVFTTYSQLQSVKGKDTPRRQFVRNIAQKAVFILDESHNAGGGTSSQRKAKDAAPTTAEFVREALGATEHGAFYSSATYAKRPDVMSLYFKTDMRFAVEDIGALAAAISEGGIPLQQVVAAQLTEAGQYIRRERSFEGASVDVVQGKADMQSAEQSATIMRSILEFDKIKQKSLAAVNIEGLASGESAEGNRAVGEKGASSTIFTSVMHNLIGQSLLAMKAESAVEAAKEAVSRGEKPVITLANTMGSFIKEHVDEQSVAPGQEVELSFKDLYRRYLEKTRTITKRGPDGKIIEQRVLTDEELGPEGAAAYRAVLEEIERSNFGSLPISPIDYITAQLEAAGISVGEITGRTASVDYSSGTPVYRPRRPSPAGNIEVMRDFNGGKTDVIILNQSGSTGISLHSSSTFADTRKRTMIIVQPELNIDVFMQTLGRVFRTGQTVPPAYKLLTSDLPAEKRPAAILGKKMAGLNANTTASRKTDTTFQNIPDFLNEYGDLVAAQIMEEHPEIHKALGEPLKEGNGGYEREDAVRKVTGRIPMLALAEQQALYDLIEAEYADLIAQLEATGTANLEAKTLPLDAKLVSSEDLTAAKDVGVASPFAEGSKIGLFDVRSLGKPFSPEQVNELIKQGKEVPLNLERVWEDTSVWLKKRLETVRDEATRESISDRVKDQFRRVRTIASSYGVGDPVLVSVKDNTYTGVVVRIERKGAGSPSAPSSWKMTIAVADAARQITVPFSKILFGSQDVGIGQVSVSRSKKQLSSVLDEFSSKRTASREKRYIAFGNVLAAYSSVGNKGQVVNFEDSDGNVHAGILFNKNATLKEIVGFSDVSIPDYDSMAKYFVATKNEGVLKSVDKNLTISSRGGYWTFATPAAKAKGAQFFLNGKLLDAAGRDFIKSGNMMKATVPEDVAKKMVDALHQQGFGIVAGSHVEEARSVMGLAKTDAEQGPAVRLSATDKSVPSPMPSPDVRQEADRVSGMWANGPAVHVVDSVGALPDHIQEQIASKDGQGHVEAVYHQGEMWLVADQMSSAEDVQRVMAHEGVGHHGLRLIMADHVLDHTLDMAWQNRTVREEAEAIADQYGLDVKDKSQRREATEEVLAHWAGEGKKAGVLDRLVAAVRQAVRRVFPSLKMSDAEVRTLISQARRAVETGQGAQFSTLEREAKPMLSLVQKAMEEAALAGRPMTKEQATEEMYRNRSFVMKIFEGRDTAELQVNRAAVAMQKTVQRLAGSTKWKYNPLSVLSSEKEVKDTQRSRDLDYAMLVYRELQIDPSKGQAFRAWAHDQIEGRGTRKAKGEDRVRILEQLRALDLAESLTAEQKEFVDVVMDRAFAEVGATAQNAGLVNRLLDNYVRRLWKFPKGDPRNFRYGTGHAFKTSTTANRARSLETIFDGWMKGYDLKVKGITNSWTAISNEISSIVANKAFVQNARAQGVFSTRALHGYAPLQAHGFDVWVRKAGVRIDLDDAYGFLGTDGQGRGMYVSPPKQVWAVYADQNSRRAKKLFSENEEASARDMVNELQLAGHADARLELRQMVDVFEKVSLYAPSQVAEISNRVTRTLSEDSLWRAGWPSVAARFNASAKAWILQTSLFHHFAGTYSWWFGVDHGAFEALRRGDLVGYVKAVASSLDPVTAHKRGLQRIKDNDPIVRIMAKNGLKIDNQADWSESMLRETKGVTETLVTALSGRVPGADRALAMIKAGKLFREKSSHALFNRFFAGLKVEAAVAEFAKELRRETRDALREGRQPNIDLAAERAAVQVNSDFGGQHYQRKGRNPEVQKWLQFLLLAPDWTESNWRTVTGTVPGLNDAIAEGFNEVPDPKGMDETFRGFWARIIVKGGLSTLFANMAIAALFGDDDDHWLDFYKEQMSSWEQFKKARWTGVDLTPIFKAAGWELEDGQRKVVSLLGQFADPFRLAEPDKIIKHKASPVLRVPLTLLSGTDFRGRPYTGFKELVETQQIVKKTRYNEQEGFYNALPSMLLDIARNTQPIQVGVAMRYALGEMDGATAIMQAVGLRAGDYYTRLPVYDEFRQIASRIEGEKKQLKHFALLQQSYAGYQSHDPAQARQFREEHKREFEAMAGLKAGVGAEVQSLNKILDAYQRAQADIRKIQNLTKRYRLDTRENRDQARTQERKIQEIMQDFVDKYGDREPAL